MVKLNEKQAQLFLDKNFGSLATIRDDGTPHVTPVWVDYDGEHVLFNTATGRAKWHHMRRDPRVTIEVYSQDDPYEYVTVTGTGRARGERRGEPAHRQAVREVHREPEVPEPPAGRAPRDRAHHARARLLISICEVGPRDGLQNEKDVLRAQDPRRARQPARGGRPARRRGGQLRQRGTRAADGRGGGGRRRRSSGERARSTRVSR